MMQFHLQDYEVSSTSSINGSRALEEQKSYYALIYKNESTIVPGVKHQEFGPTKCALLFMKHKAILVAQRLNISAFYCQLFQMTWTESPIANLRRYIATNSCRLKVV